MHQCPVDGTPVLVIYESCVDGSVKRFYACGSCDLCELWPNWRRALKHRVRREG